MNSSIDGADPRGRYFATSQYPEGVTPMGDTRGFSRLWDCDAEGVSKSTVLEAGWSRGQVVRMDQPVIVLTALGPMYDVSANPASWRPGV